MSAAHRGLKHSEQTKAAIGMANHRRRATSEHDLDPRAPDDVLDESMTAADIVWTLEHLRFAGRDRLATLQIDRSVRDYLIDALRRNGPACSR